MPSFRLLSLRRAARPEPEPGLELAPMKALSERSKLGDTDAALAMQSPDDPERRRLKLKPSNPAAMPLTSGSTTTSALAPTRASPKPAHTRARSAQRPEPEQSASLPQPEKKAALLHASPPPASQDKHADARAGMSSSLHPCEHGSRMRHVRNHKTQCVSGVSRAYRPPPFPLAFPQSNHTHTHSEAGSNAYLDALDVEEQPRLVGLVYVMGVFGTAE